MDRSVLVFGQMKEPPGARYLVGFAALAVAEHFRDQLGRNVLFVVDNVYRYVQAGMEVSGLLGRMPSRVGYQPTLAAGDCVLMASNLVASLRPWTLPVSSAPQRLLHCEFIPPQTRPAAGIPPVGPSEPWHELLTPLEKALCGVEGLDDGTPVVISDGTKAWLSPALPSWEAYLEAGGMEPDPVELYRWDLEVRDWGLDRLID